MKKRKNTLKIIASTSVTLFSLFTLFVSSFAWFMANRKADADGTGFVTTAGVNKIERIDVFQEVRTENTTVSPTDYLYSSIAYCSYTHASGWSTTNGKIPLGTYSQEDNTHSVLIYITLTETLDSYQLKFKTTTSFDDSRVKAGEDNQINGTSNPMSSFIDFRYLNLTSSLSSSNSQYDLREHIATNDSLSFVSVSSPSSESDYKTSVGIDSVSSNTKYIAIVVEYNVSVVNYIFYTLNFSNNLLDKEDSNIPFACDWSIDLQ